MRIISRTDHEGPDYRARLTFADGSSVEVGADDVDEWCELLTEAVGDAASRPGGAVFSLDVTGPVEMLPYADSRIHP